MSAILFFSDLHLGDSRNSITYEEENLASLGSLIRRRKYAAVINLGDTVSRKEFLRDNMSAEEVFEKYRRWRDALGVPFRECTIYRERGFFEEFFGQKADSCWEDIPGTAVITLSPDDVEDHQCSAAQWQWLSEMLDRTAGKTVLIGSHVPYPGCCSRPVTPGIYLPIDDAVRQKLENHQGAVFWAGGHFHWHDDPPLHQGSLTAFTGGRFLLETHPDRYTYVREVDLDTLAVRTLTDLTCEK